MAVENFERYLVPNRADGNIVTIVINVSQKVTFWEGTVSGRCHIRRMSLHGHHRQGEDLWHCAVMQTSFQGEKLPYCDEDSEINESQAFVIKVGISFHRSVIKLSVVVGIILHFSVIKLSVKNLT